MPGCSKIAQEYIIVGSSQVVAEVVMCRDVAPGSLVAVAVDPVKQFLQRRGQARRAAFHCFQHVAVAQQQANQRDQVVAAPVAVHVGLTAADRPAICDLAVEAGVGNTDVRFRSGAVILAKTVFVGAVGQQQCAALQAAQPRQHDAAGQPVQQAGLDRAGQVPGRGQGYRFHCAFSISGPFFAG
jgi:hypothetical protein